MGVSAPRGRARRAPAPDTVSSPTPQLDALTQAAPDLVDRIFDYVVQLVPEISARRLQIKVALREEFGASEGYIRRRELTPGQLEAEVERLLDEHGRNVYTVARILGISPNTVRRRIRTRLASVRKIAKHP